MRKESKGGRPMWSNCKINSFCFPKYILDLSLSGEEMAGGIQRLFEWRERLYKNVYGIEK